MKKPLLISGALVLGIATVLGWSFELPRVEETVGAYDLLFRSGLIGLLVGILVGVLLATREQSFIAKFQSFASSLLLFSILSALLGHFSNRTLTNGESSIDHMTVKQVTATWKDRGLSRQELSSPPDGYYIFVETEDGTVRLLREGASAPNIGPSRTIPVQKLTGFWGYSRYSISAEEDE